jgi:hypothetical protein
MAEKYTQAVVRLVEDGRKTIEDIEAMKRTHEELDGFEEVDKDYYPSLCEALTILQQTQ